MIMERLIDTVVDALYREGLVQVEVSARHVHLNRQDMDLLFGEEKSLTPLRDLSQPGQFLSEERITLVGPKGRKEHVAILGPLRENSQVELSQSDCVALGIRAPVRESGLVEGSAPIILEGPKGQLHLKEGVMIAHKHVHMPPEIAAELGLCDKQRVSVQVFSGRPVVFKDVIVRVSSQFRCRMHIDFDEANAAAVSGFTLGKIVGIAAGTERNRV